MIYFKVQNLNIQVSETNIKIINSYQQTNKENMFQIINEIYKRVPTIYKTNRTINNLVGEWIIHNICYKLHIFRNRTKDTDLEQEISNPIYNTLCNFLGRR